MTNFFTTGWAKHLALSALLVGETVLAQAQSSDTLNYFYLVENEPSSLTLEQAIQGALEKNHDIIIARNEQEVTRNNATIGNAGFLPRLSLTSGYQHSINDTYIEFAGEMPPIDRENAQSTQLNGAIELTYTLFDGLSRFYTYSRLQELQRVADAQTQQAIENTVYQVISTFLEVARLQEEVTINQETVALSRERLQRVENRYLFGGSTKLEVLNAEVDLNTDSVTLAQSRLNYANAQRNLNVFRGQSPSTIFRTQDNFDVNRQLDLEQLLEQSKQGNAALRLANYNLNAARLNEKVSQASYLPSLNLSGSYGYTKQENDANFLILQEQLGFTGGVSLNYTLFDGNVRSTQAQNATIRAENQARSLEQTQLAVQRDLLNAYAVYENSLYLLDQERINLETAQLNFERSESALQLGQIDATAFRDAQLNLTRARKRINDLFYQAKQAEARLYQVAGTLGQDVGE